MMDELLKELTPVVAHETQRASEQYGDRYALAHEQDALFDIIDGRCADVVLISNLSLQAFQEYIGAAVVDRIRPTVVCPSAEGTISWRIK